MWILLVKNKNLYEGGNCCVDVYCHKSLDEAKEHATYFQPGTWDLIERYAH